MPRIIEYARGSWSLTWLALFLVLFLAFLPDLVGLFSGGGETDKEMALATPEYQVEEPFTAKSIEEGEMSPLEEVQYLLESESSATVSSQDEARAMLNPEAAGLTQNEETRIQRTISHTELQQKANKRILQSAIANCRKIVLDLESGVYENTRLQLVQYIGLLEAFTSKDNIGVIGDVGQMLRRSEIQVTGAMHSEGVPRTIVQAWSRTEATRLLSIQSGKVDIPPFQPHFQLKAVYFSRSGDDFGRLYSQKPTYVSFVGELESEDVDRVELYRGNTYMGDLRLRIQKLPSGRKKGILWYQGGLIGGLHSVVIYGKDGSKLTRTFQFQPPQNQDRWNKQPTNTWWASYESDRGDVSRLFIRPRQGRKSYYTTFDKSSRFLVF